MRLTNNPSGPSTNLFTNPKKRTGNGIRTANGIADALKRSSGYQIPPRPLRHLITVESEILPKIAAPTKRVRTVKDSNIALKQVQHEPILPTPDGTKQAPIKASLGM